MENETTRSRVDDDIYLTPKNLIEGRVTKNKSGELVQKRYNDPPESKNLKVGNEDLRSKQQKTKMRKKRMSTRFWEWRCRKSVAVVIGLIIALFIIMGIVVGCIVILGNGKLKACITIQNILHYRVKNSYLLILDKEFLYYA